MQNEYTHNECADKVLRAIKGLGLPIQKVNVDTDLESNYHSPGMTFTTTVTITMSGDLKKAD